MEHVFSEKEVLKILERLGELGLLKGIHPSLIWDDWVAEKVSLVQGFSCPIEWKVEQELPLEVIIYSLWMLRVKGENVKSFCNRLHFPVSIRSVILEANKLASRTPRQCEQRSPNDFVELFEHTHESALIAVWIGMQDQEECRQAIGQYLSEWRFVSPTTTGDTLRDLGIPPSPVYREILTTLRAAWLDGLIVDSEEEVELLQKLVEKLKQNGSVA
jgi:tRNA nucleotidyltransferase (CCA-adding enzyme)